ncbi:MAG TPA: thermonuclease family protein [Desulfuromonadales bacterium]
MILPSILTRCFCRVLFLTLLLLAVAAGTGAGELRGRVEWIYDGDTIKVAGVGKVRLLGIDTPEREESDKDRFFIKLGGNGKTLRRIAGEALRFNIATIKGKDVRLTLDHEKRDAYGRLLAYVTLPDGRLLNRLLLEKGYAVVYRRFDFRLKEDFLAAEAEARHRKVGLWAR